MKKAVKVCVRTRPTQNFAQGNLIIEQSENTVTCQVIIIIVLKLITFISFIIIY